MPIDWRETVLSDVVALKRGHDLPTPTRRPGRVPVVGSFGITGWHDEAKAPAPGVTIGRSGASIGTAAYVNEPYWPLNTCLYVTDFRGNDPRWIYHLLDLIDFTAYNSGSAQPSLNRNFLAQIPVTVPELSEQRRITSVLGALDDLIEVEQETSDRADELWRTLVHAELVGSIERRLSSLATFVNGKNFTKGATGTGLPVIRTPEVRIGPSKSTVRNDVDAAHANIAEPGDILFVWSGSLLVGRWLWERGLINQHIFKVIPHHDTPPWLAMWAIEELMHDFLGVAADKATTMGHIKRSDLDRRVALPDPSRWSSLDRMIRPLWDETLQARRHVVDLARTRDQLLPLLMSGKLQVSDDLAVA